MIPPVDKARTNRSWIRAQARSTDGREVWCNMPRQSVERARHNVVTYGAAWWLGWRLDESDVAELFKAMDGGAR